MVHKRDLAIFYLWRNGFATFLIALFSFSFTIANYYQQDLLFGVTRIFFDNLYSVLFFGTVWLLDYLLFELYKTGLELIVYYIDDRQFFQLIHVTDILGMLISLVVTFVFVMVGQDSVLELNGIFLGLFMFARVIKQIIKKYKKQRGVQS